MNATTSLRRSLLALLLALATAMTLMVATPNFAKAADNRGWLRPDATGHCSWDPVRYWVQRCDVYSPSMKRNIPVQIVPAARGGNAGLYLLDGLRATERTNAWVKDVNAAAVYANSNITLVMPVGGESSFYADWAHDPKYGEGKPYMWETFLTRELPGYLQRQFGVSPRNNSIIGLSMGGTAAMNLAAKHPNQFRQVLSFSGYLTTTLPGMQTMLRLSMLDAGGYNLNAMYGSMINPQRFANDPFLNMSGLRNSDVYISAGSGVPGAADAKYLPQHKAAGSALEFGAMLSTRIWEAKARAQGLRVTSDYPAQGLHNWDQFGYQLHKTKGRVLTHMNAW